MCKQITIVAGPNGAGKTTFCMEMIDDGIIEYFVNADEIAKSLVHIVDPGIRNIRAGKLFLRRLYRSIELEQKVCFETALSGLSYVRLIRQLKQKGWKVTLYYLALESVDLSKLRVEERVLHGGHDIPVSDIERRFPKSLYNLFTHYLIEVDEVYCILNTNEPQLIFTKLNDEIDIINSVYFEKLKWLAGNLNERK